MVAQRRPFSAFYAYKERKIKAETFIPDCHSAPYLFEGGNKNKDQSDRISVIFGTFLFLAFNTEDKKNTWFL